MDSPKGSLPGLHHKSKAIEQGSQAAESDSKQSDAPGAGFGSE